MLSWRRPAKQLRQALLRRADTWIERGEPAGIRTRDPLIKSQMLYRLSYGLARGAHLS